MNDSWVIENENDETQRPGQLDLMAQFRIFMAAGCPERLFSVCMCCRYGKADAIRNLTILALQEGFASAGLAIHPSPVLASQFLEPGRLKGWRQRWLPDGPRLKAVQVLPDFAAKSMCNGEWMGSIHIQALMQPGQFMMLREWVKLRKHKDNCPPIVFFDECHQFSKGNKWGEVARKLHDLGCLIVVLTATPYRNDGDDIFGFRRKPVSETTSREIKYIQPHSSDPDKLELHTSTRDETECVLEADVEVPFAQGWEEGPLARVSFDLIDWNMAGYGEFAGKDCRLSELPKNDARKVLPTVYRDPSAIAEAARRAIKHVKDFRTTVPDATVVWYGMNDDGTASENQKAISAAIKKECPSMKVAIATMSSDEEGDQRSKDLISKFCDDPKKPYDHLVLKQMGAAGLDSDRICVVVLWNTVRTLNQMIQMAMRGGNAALKDHFVIVGLKDCMTEDRLAAWIKGEGGQYVNATETDHEMELIDRKELPEAGYIAVDVADAGMFDSDGKAISFEGVRLASYVISTWPGLIRDKTIPQIAEDAKALGIHAPDVPEDVCFEDTTTECNRYRSNLGEWVKKIGRKIFYKKHGRVGTKGDAAEHGEIYKEVTKLIKKRSGVNASWDGKNKERSQSPLDYKKWTATAEAMWMEVCNG